MKLVDILVREFSKWPEGFECLSQLKHNGSIINGKGFDGRVLAWLEIAGDTFPAGVIVTRAEWQAAVDALNAPKVVEWDGAGLPPIGIDCEMKKADSWVLVNILAHIVDDPRFNPIAIYMEANDPSARVGQAVASRFRPVITAEQVAAEEREKAIKEMMMHGVDAGDSTIEYSCAALYDAGWRRSNES